MSALGRGFRDLYGGGKAPSFKDQLASIERAAGGVTKAAREVGVNRSTWQRWKSGAIKAPKADRARVLGITARMANLPSDRPTDSTVTLRTQESTGRKRNLGAANLKLRPGTMRDTERRWVETGDGEAAADTFRGGVGDEFYRDTYLSDEAPDEEYGDSPVLPDDIAVA